MITKVNAVTECWYQAEISLIGSDDWFKYSHKTFDQLCEIKDYLENERKGLQKDFILRAVKVTHTEEPLDL